MQLEQQLECLRELGITLNDGVAVSDLLDAWSRGRYESTPFRLLLTWLGAEMDRAPWKFSPHVLTFDCESIDDSGCYTSLIDDICGLASATHYVKDVEDFVDFETDVGWIKCKIDGVRHKWDVEVCRDWADTIALAKIMTKIERNEKHFYKLNDDGQGLTVLYLDRNAANSLAGLTGQTLKPMADFDG